MGERRGKKTRAPRAETGGQLLTADPGPCGCVACSDIKSKVKNLNIKLAFMLFGVLKYQC